MFVFLRLLLAVTVLAAAPGAAAAVSVTDDAGRTVTLNKPARRIISLAPHATEILYAAGAGAHVVGVSEYSDYPPEARQLPSVGGSAAADMERLITLKPDLVVGWSSGNSGSQLAKLRQLGIPVYESEPRSFAAIASSVERLAILAGTADAGHAAARVFRQRLEALASRYQDRSPVRVFYQIWRSPLMTLNDEHMVSQVLRLCGGQNIFGRLPQLAPTVSMEAVLQADPEAIITSGNGNDEPFSGWRRFPQLTAVARGNLFTIDGDLINRSGPRILDGAEILCRQLDAARSRRQSSSSVN